MNTKEIKKSPPQIDRLFQLAQTVREKGKAEDLSQDDLKSIAQPNPLMVYLPCYLLHP